MSRLKASDPAAAELCRAWGLEPDEVRGIHFHLEVGGLATVEVAKFVTEEQGQTTLLLLKRYNLVPVEEPEGGDLDQP